MNGFGVPFQSELLGCNENYSCNTNSLVHSNWSVIDLKSNDLSHIESRLEELFSPRHIFEKLFNPEGVEGYEDIVKQCIDESKKDEDKCALTLCELFLTFADNKNAPIPSWAWKSKSQ